MRIATIGGGPGGLYASLLLKRASPQLSVTVFERNPRGATYGWGVVFSDRTLTSFREADYKTYVDITDHFVIWDAIDIRYQDRLVRAGGQVFSGIARRRLLDILTDRCLEVGVKVQFETEADVSSLGGYDLVIAADGINSAARASREAVFKPRIREGRARYIWFGTTLPLDSFTFIFRSNDDGLFQVHAYPFDGTTSTFIVECSERTWLNAGLDARSEAESIAYCEKLFAEDLRGNALMSNQSKWISFPTLETRSWIDTELGSVPTALLGDSAHTAHFSIGSGTKLAMEDAIALANAFEERGASGGDPDALRAALADYQMERKPVVERFQEAAKQSQSYFESTERYQELEPAQFVFHLLTRSGRIDYSNLRQRDPHLVEHVDRWFAAHSGGNERAVLAPPPALVPFDLSGVSLDNRVVLSPVSMGSSPEGIIAGADRDRILSATEASVGLVLTDEVAVSAHGRITRGDAGLYGDAQAGAFHSLLEARGPARVAVRLNHAGARGATKPRAGGLDRPLGPGGWPLLAASPMPYGRNTTPFALDDRTRSEVLEDYASAARNAGLAGFDAVVIEMGRGYLLGGFLSPLTNHRTDPLGGDRGGRMSFPLEVFERVRAEFPGPVAVSVCADDWQRGGATVDDAAALVAELRTRGCALIEITAGFTTPRFTPHLDPYYLTVLSERIRNDCGVPTLVGAGITTIDQINTLLGGARADLCILRRDA
ncbi:MAG: FAD-dependent monooxygenase [Actinomycetota bacterium]